MDSDLSLIVMLTHNDKTVENAYEVFDIDYKKIYSLGYRGILFDIDNTLAHHGEDSTPEVDNLFRQIHSVGLKTLLLSNNDTERIERFIKNIDTPYIPDAEKPKVDNYYKALDVLQLKKEEVIVIGDQIFTDIYGVNKSGMTSILVDFLRHDNETKFGKLRMIEKYILKFYRLSKKCRNRNNSVLLQRGDFENVKKNGRLFCEINPVCYAIALKKENIKRHIKNLFTGERFSREKVRRNCRTLYGSIILI